MIRLNVFIRVKEEKREAVLVAAKELVTFLKVQPVKMSL